MKAMAIQCCRVRTAAVLAFRDWRRQQTAKKKLNWTPRAKRIFTLALGMSVVVALLGPAIFAAFPEQWRGPVALGAWIDQRGVVAVETVCRCRRRIGTVHHFSRSLPAVGMTHGERG